MTSSVSEIIHTATHFTYNLKDVEGLATFGVMLRGPLGYFGVWADGVVIDPSELSTEGNPYYPDIPIELAVTASTQPRTNALKWSNTTPSEPTITAAVEINAKQYALDKLWVKGLVRPESDGRTPESK